MTARRDRRAFRFRSPLRRSPRSARRSLELCASDPACDRRRACETPVGPQRRASMLALVLAFVVGGVTLLPALFLLVLAVLVYGSPVVTSPPLVRAPAVALPDDELAPLLRVYRAGWLTIRRTHDPTETDKGTYVGMVVSGYRSFMESRTKESRKTAKPKDQFYAVLKQTSFYLYENESMAECWNVLDMTNFKVEIWPTGERDGELFVKRNAIMLAPRATTGEEQDPWFLFPKVNSDKEDWYHSLILSAKLALAALPDTRSALANDALMFSSDDMAHLIEGIDGQTDLIPTRWLNAILGRIFFSVYKTKKLESYLISRIVSKLKRVKIPSILSEIVVKQVDVGHTVPSLGKPLLKELLPSGETSVELAFSYLGEFRITISTTATIPLGSHFKPYVVHLVLAVVLKEVEGTLVVRIKGPPSNRLWVGFREMPKLGLKVEPVVSTRRMDWAVITAPIESRIKEVIMESIVLPHMDDFPFFDTSDYEARGGIFGEAIRKEVDPLDSATEGGVETADGDDGQEIEGVDSILLDTKDSVSETLRRRTKAIPDGETSSSRSTGSPTSSLAGFSLAAWANTNREKALTRDGMKSWFPKKIISITNPADIPAPSSADPSRTPSVVPSRSSSLSTRPPSTSFSESTTTVTNGADELAKLKDVLFKSAVAREREVSATSTSGDSTAETDSEALLGASILAEPSALSLTAPVKIPTPTPTIHEELSSEEDPEAEVHEGEPAELKKSASSAFSLVEHTNSPTAILPTPTPAPTKPPLPSRPSFSPSVPALPPAPPRRTHTPAASADSSTANSILQAWRTKAAATDKQALMNNAKEGLKRWGANWASANTAGRGVAGRLNGAGEVDTATNGRAESGGSSNGDRDLSYKDFRATKQSLDLPAGAYIDLASTSIGSDSSDPIPIASVAPSSVKSFDPSSPNSRDTSSDTSSSLKRRISVSTSAGYFVPAPGQSTTRISSPSPAASFSTSPTTPSKLPPLPRKDGPGASPVVGYQGSKMMAIPGIRDESRREAVKEDHIEEIAPTSVEVKERVKLVVPAWLLPGRAGTFAPPSLAGASALTEGSQETETRTEAGVSEQ